MSRHCGLDPQSRGEGAWLTTSPIQASIPSPLMGEESKVRVTSRQSHHSSTSAPSFPSRRAVYGTRTIRRLRLLTESRESRRDSPETRQSTGRSGQRHAEYLLDTTVAQARTGFKTVFTTRGIPSIPIHKHPCKLIRPIYNLH